MNPFVGTAAGRPDRIPGDAAGGTTPAAAVPFGLVAFGPDTVPAGVRRGGGYAYEDRRVRGFSPLHVSGGGCPAFGTVTLLPVAGRAEAPRAPVFDHARERAVPGRYDVVLDPGTRSAIGVSLTATTRVAAARMRFPPGRPATIVLTGGAARATAHGGLEVTAPAGTFCRRALGARVSVAAAFRPAPRAVRIDGGRAVATFAPGATVVVWMGVSFTDAAGARRNLRAEGGGRSFAGLRLTAQRRWATALDAARVHGGARGARVQFATALYHALLAPTALSDVDGRYRGPDGRVHRAVGWTRRSTIAGWDAYRTQFPLLAMLFPGIARDVARSLLSAGREGCLPAWELAGVPLSLMPGSPAAILLAEAHAFGVGGFDAPAALRRAVRSATTPCRSAGAVERPGLADELALGYVGLERAGGPAEHEADPAVPWGAAATTLEDAVADFAIGRLAQRLGRTALAAQFARRAGAWRALVDPATRAIGPRLASGAFPSPPADPASDEGFAEGSAAQYAWAVPHDLARLAASMGGRSVALTRLDAVLARLADGPRSAHADLANEPSFGIPWVYDALGTPWRTQQVVRRALLTLYAPAPAGLPGNDDTGALSAWWVLGALGLYPAIPGDDRLAVGSPLFPRADLRLGGRRLTILGRHTTAGRAGGPYVRRATLAGHRLRRPWVRFAALARGGRLVFDLGARPEHAGFSRSARARPRPTGTGTPAG